MGVPEGAVKTVKVVVAGINGRMGRSSARAIIQDPGFELVGAFGSAGAPYVGKDLSHILQVTDCGNTGILVSNGFLDSVAGAAADVLLDFTRAEAAVTNSKLALEHGIRPVIGTSGLPPDKVEALSQMAANKKLGAMVVPNFSLGAVLMMEFAKQAATIFKNVEIVEIHHTKKVDAPSGTAMHTAVELSKGGDQFNQTEVKEKELWQGARGAKTNAGVRVHALRLPGLLSHQEVIFGSEGELLTIRHDSFNTDCFTRGILLALKSVMTLDHLVVGLDEVVIGTGKA